MITRRTGELRCHCGCPRHPTDHVVIAGDVVYCNFACHAAHEPHGMPLAYEHRDAIIGDNA